METYFAPSERLVDDELKKEIELVSKNSIIDGLLHSVSSLLAVLNEHRQILTLNDSLLEAIGLGNPEVLGLRMGEALECIHSCNERNPWGQIFIVHKWSQSYQSAL